MKDYRVKESALPLLRAQKGSRLVAWLLALWFGAGLSPKAPGTIGSLFSLPLAVLAIWGAGAWGVLGTAVIVFFAGWWATAVVLKTQKNHDPGFVVIDETLGQVLAFLGVAGGPLSAIDVILGFAFFRLFDIFKPFPASFFDKKVPNAFGVMMDDAVAGLYAALLLYLYRIVLF